MEISFQKSTLDVQERASLMPEEIIEIFTSEELENFASYMSEEYLLTPEQERLIINELSLILLLFTDINSLETSILNITQSKLSATGITRSFIDLIYSRVEDFYTEMFTAKSEETTKPESVIAPVLPQAPDTKETIAPLRTMESDVDKVHGYGAYRELYPDAQAEPVHQSNQHDTLARPSIAPLPSYGTEEK